jgi:hypothetical protein
MSTNDTLNDRISTLEQVATSALNTLSMITGGRFSADHRAGPQAPDAGSGQQFNPNTPYDQ